MATIRNPTPYGLFSLPIRRVVSAGEVVDGLTDEEADAVCASGVFERGVLVTGPEPVPEVKAEETEPETDETTDAEEQPARPAGRRSSQRGAAKVEEVVEDERETR